VDITVLCTDAGHPVFPKLEQWVERMRLSHEVHLVSSLQEVAQGDILFLVSAARLVPRSVRERFRAALVLHASDLPSGRGWSPHVWQILEGQSSITVSVIGAEDLLDTGDIWAQRAFVLQGHELADEINESLFATELGLMDYIVENFATIRPVAQGAEGVSVYRKRTPEDSRIDPSDTIAAQFDLLRVADPARYPAFFDFRGCRYKVILKKMD
jgi:methionyl-tRNA formyltransferase